MSQYYLMSQLPSLDGLSENSPIPISEERFHGLCNQFLDKKLLKLLNTLTLIPKQNEEKTGFQIIDLWNENEKNLRLALAVLRAEKMNKAFDAGSLNFSSKTTEAAHTAAESDNPLAAEQFLNKFRLDFLESLRPMDNFSDQAVFYYALKLKLILRIARFDTEKGQKAYKDIYNSIMIKGQEAD